MGKPKSLFRQQAHVLLVGALMTAGTLSSCATRPSEAVLQPAVVTGGKSSITILSATDRTKDIARKGFSGGRSMSLAYEEYTISIPPDHKPSEIEYPKAKPDGHRDFVVTSRRSLDRRGFMALASKPAVDGSVGLFVHGFNYSYQEGLFRLAQIAVDAEAKAVPVLFSWPSEAKITGYVSDRDAALFARDDLVKVISEMASRRDVKKFVLFGHSMGGFLIMEALRQVKLEGRGDILDKLSVVLAAPDIDADVFRKQLMVVGPMKTPLTLFVAKDDRALQLSSFLGGDRPRAGRLDIDDPVIEEAAERYRIRVVDITSLDASDGLGHDRYANLAALGPQIASLERKRGTSPTQAGAFVFDAAASIVSSPFRLVGRAVAGQ